MVHEISPICNFLFGSIKMNILTDTVDVGLTVWKVKGIYTQERPHCGVHDIYPVEQKGDTVPLPEM